MRRRRSPLKHPQKISQNHVDNRQQPPHLCGVKSVNHENEMPVFVDNENRVHCLLYPHPVIVVCNGIVPV